MKYRIAEGFTLIEILVVAILVAMMSATVFRLMESGSRISMKGISRVETTLEARRILRQIRKDLKTACMPLAARDGAQLSLDSLFFEGGTDGLVQYSFCCFPSLGKVEECVAILPEETRRYLNIVRYFLEPVGDSTSFKRLVREEYFNPALPQYREYPQGKRRSVLSERVNYFRIERYCLKPSLPFPDQDLLWVTLQLGAGGPVKVEGTNEVWKQAPEGGLICDFFDVVYPEFLNAMKRNLPMNRNWHNWLLWKEN